MYTHYKIHWLDVGLEAALLARRVPVPGARPMVKRDKGKENQVAKLFETIRTDANISHLERIGQRDSLEQLVCTAALADVFPDYALTKESAFYKTTDPGSVSPELNKVASFNQPAKRNPRIA
jgi:hypothetical protein